MAMLKTALWPADATETKSVFIITELFQLSRHTVFERLNK